jgi:type IV pilus assembly protein PilC
MAIYQYKAKTAEGKTVKGSIEAPDENGFYARLKEQNYYVISWSEAEKKQKTPKLKPKQLAEFCRSLGTLLAAGVSLVRALGIVSQEEALKENQRKIYENLLASVRQGNTLSDAMEAQGDSFPQLLVHMTRSSEASGNMDQVSMRMASHYEKDYRLRSKVHGAMIYPCILGFLIVVVVAFIFTFVIPQFSDMFAQMESLPLPTRVIMGLSDFLSNHWIVAILGLIGLVILIRMIFHIPAVRLWKDRTKIRMPLIGKLLKVIYTARFARTLSSLYSSGIPIVTALQIGKKTVGNAYIEAQFDRAIDQVRSGEKLSDAIGGIDGFVRKLMENVRIGEETGSLDGMLDSIADTLDYESEIAINKMVSFLEPVMIILMALIVGFVMISVILPVYNSYGSIEASAYH